MFLAATGLFCVRLGLFLHSAPGKAGGRSGSRRVQLRFRQLVMSQTARYRCPVEAGAARMAVPDFQTMMLPVLRAAGRGEVRVQTLVSDIASEFTLGDDDLTETLPSGTQRTIINRLSWAVVYLTKAGLLSRQRRGVYELTLRGRAVLERPLAKIDIRFLSQFDEFERFRTGAAEQPGAMAEAALVVPAGTPEERIDAAFAESVAALKDELLDRVRAMQPTGFERLILELMLAMGYGAAGSGEHVGRSRDGGIDGVINEDVLGLDVIYLQAKRYAEGNGIGVEKIREFAGSLDERGATKGVFVTTSHFAPPARAYAERSPKRLVLIDGDELSRLLIRSGVGVRLTRTIALKRVDGEYFDEISV
jgi:restriction system protein